MQKATGAASNMHGNMYCFDAIFETLSVREFSCSPPKAASGTRKIAEEVQKTITLALLRLKKSIFGGKNRMKVKLEQKSFHSSSEIPSHCSKQTGWCVKKQKKEITLHTHI